MATPRFQLLERSCHAPKFTKTGCAKPPCAAGPALSGNCCSPPNNERYADGRTDDLFGQQVDSATEHSQANKHDGRTPPISIIRGRCRDLREPLLCHDLPATDVLRIRRLTGLLLAQA